METTILQWGIIVGVLFSCGDTMVPKIEYDYIRRLGIVVSMKEYDLTRFSHQRTVHSFQPPDPTKFLQW